VYTYCYFQNTQALMLYVDQFPEIVIISDTIISSRTLNCGMSVMPESKAPRMVVKKKLLECFTADRERSKSYKQIWGTWTEEIAFRCGIERFMGFERQFEVC